MNLPRHRPSVWYFLSYVYATSLVMIEPLKMNGTAILVFANSSKEELKHKTIANGEILFNGLTKHTITTVSKTGLPYFHFTENEQEGSGFGERFVNAIAAIFEKGFERVITIGNDTPQLKVSDILRADRVLGQNKFVLGPSTDGGFYLMGLNKSHLNSKLLLALPWQTSRLAKSITDLFESKKIRVEFLRRLFDLDKPSDLRKVLLVYNSIPPHIFQLILEQLALFFTRFWHYIISSYFFIKSEYFNKGSPHLTSI